jgi:hypothetical protein
MAEYRLGDHLLVTSAARDELAKLRKSYVELGEALRADFRKRFAMIRTADELFASYPDEIRRAVNRMVSCAAEDLAALKIYHWDEAALERRVDERAGVLLKKFENVREQYLSIVLAAHEREALRDNAGQSSPGIIGGGFGVEGAAKGIAIAAAANVAIGIAQGAANAVGKAFATSGDAQKKRHLLQAPATRDDLADVLREIGVEGHRLVADIANSERQEVVFEVVGDAATQKADALTANVSAGRVPVDEIAVVLTEALQLNPFHERAWRLWVERMGDEDGSIVLAASDLGATDLAAFKQSLLEQTRAGLAWSTLQECSASGEQLEARAVFLGAPFEKHRIEIERICDALKAKSVALDEARRTFNGKIYATAEEMESARAEAADRAQRTVGGSVYNSRHEADQARDVQRRTFRDTIYNTIETADGARSHYIRSRSILYYIAIIFFPFPSAIVTLFKPFPYWLRAFSFFWMVIFISGLTTYFFFFSAPSVGANYDPYSLYGTLFGYAFLSCIWSAVLVGAAEIIEIPQRAVYHHYILPSGNIVDLRKLEISKNDTDIVQLYLTFAILIFFGSFMFLFTDSPLFFLFLGAAFMIAFFAFNFDKSTRIKQAADLEREQRRALGILED